MSLAPIRTVVVTAWVVLAVGSACGEGNDADDDADLPDASVPDDGPVIVPSDPDVYEVPDERPLPPAGCVAVAPPLPRAAITLTPVFSAQLQGGAGDNLTNLVPSPHHPGRWYAARRDGRVFTFHEDTPAAATEVLALGDRVLLTNHELGLMGLALDPAAAGAQALYVAYSAPPQRGGNHVATLSRFPLSADGLRADAMAEEILLALDDPAPSHNANQIGFGPDGYLYQAIGDGGNPNDRFNNGQNPNTLFGTMIRLDVSGPDATRGTAYRIPEDNPFADGTLGAPEVFAIGLRNPWRFSFDRQTGDLWVGDVGQDTWEEANLVVSGGNYGWPRMEGPDCFVDVECDPDAYAVPVWSYTHAEGASITGGHVYRGEAIPELAGQYLAADFANGTIWSVTLPDDGATPQATVQAESGLNIVAFAEDWDGELYVVHYARDGRGAVFRVEAAPPPSIDPFPRLLSQTGCVDVSNPWEVPTGMIPYQPAAELWSDGADKMRYFALPPDRRVAVTDRGDFLFPEGTVLVKHFGFGDRVHETRLYHHHAAGWSGYSYRWNPDGTDAELLDSSFTETLPSGVRWIYPSRAQCSQCHTQQANLVLGIEFLQLGEAFAAMDAIVDDFAVTPSDASQLAALQAFAVFSDEDSDSLTELAMQQPTMPDPFGDAPMEDRARAYLHSNCAGCHQPGGPTAQGSLDLRFDVPFEAMGICNVEPTQGQMYRPDGPSLRLVVPGDHGKSILWLRMETLNLFRMPALGSGVRDESGLALIRAWIDGIDSTRCPAPEDP